jgi:hypothetical protein
LLLCDTRTEPQRILNVVNRRCGLNLAAVRPGRLVVHFWTRPADLRPFCKRYRLASPHVQVTTVRYKNGLATVQPGDDFLYGQRLSETFPWAEYQRRWERRDGVQPDDRAAAPRGWCMYSWHGVDEGRIPWGALRSIWRRERQHACQNCDTPVVAWSFDYRRCGLLNMYGHIRRCCFRCRRSFEEPAGDLWPWLLAMLDADVLPASHDNGFRKTDLRPRWPTPPTRNPCDLGYLPHDPTGDDLV